MKHTIQMLAAYNRWANRQLYEAALLLSPEEFGRDTGAFFRSMRGTLNHVLVADTIWMARFTGAEYPRLGLDTILHQEAAVLWQTRQDADRRIIDFVDRCTDEALGGSFTYTTVTDRRTVTQRLSPALFHFFNHQTHHRGQAHAILTTLGKPSVALDLIYFQRTDEGRGFA